MQATRALKNAATECSHGPGITGSGHVAPVPGVHQRKAVLGPCRVCGRSQQALAHPRVPTLRPPGPRPFSLLGLWLLREHLRATPA